jgi:deoxyadenosine/deoxycytidine kinase
VVADFFLQKDPIFARLNLDDEEFKLYQQIYKHLQLKAPVPDFGYLSPNACRSS